MAEEDEGARRLTGLRRGEVAEGAARIDVAAIYIL